MESIDARYGERPDVLAASRMIRHGEVTTLVGPNGSGKSTVLRWRLPADRDRGVGVGVSGFVGLVAPHAVGAGMSA